jgi:hypothetical protein
MEIFIIDGSSMDFPIDNYIYIWEYDLLCYIYGIIIYGLKWDIFMELFLDIYGNIYNIYWISMEIFFSFMDIYPLYGS